MPETPEEPPETPDAPADTDAAGEAGREAVAGQRGGQPGYDLDESALYEQRDPDAPDE